MLVFGTRPEAIKMAPLVKAFQGHGADFETTICVTGQHREMLEQVLRLFRIVPDYNLNVMHQGQDLYDVTSRVLSGMRDVFDRYIPDVVLVHGDTTTSMAAALAAYYRQIKVGHVEAGLRTYNIYSPFPEEINRQLTGRIASYHFAPTALSRRNLLSENVDENNIFVTGNTVIDALQMVVEMLGESSRVRGEAERVIMDAGYDVSRIGKSRRMILVTGHRRENFGDGFIAICRALKKLAERYPDCDFIYPMHMNPNVRKPISEVFGTEPPANMFFTEPLEYLPFVYLMSRAYLVLTDSGGIQEEAPGLGKPVLVMRETTERPEALAAGTVKLVGANFEKIMENTSLLLDDEAAYARMSHAINPYGDGKACARILDVLR